jgi:hypothetical protein
MHGLPQIRTAPFPRDWTLKVTLPRRARGAEPFLRVEGVNSHKFTGGATNARSNRRGQGVVGYVVQ